MFKFLNVVKNIENRQDFDYFGYRTKMINFLSYACNYKKCKTFDKNIQILSLKHSFYFKSLNLYTYPRDLIFFVKTRN